MLVYNVQTTIEMGRVANVIEGCWVWLVFLRESVFFYIVYKSEITFRENVSSELIMGVVFCLS